jgi:transposase InsO family protein
LLADLVGLLALSLRPRRSIEAENLFLRRELALFKERGIRPRRVDAATRCSLALLSRLFDWRDALVVVRPETMIRWHRAGWRLFWRFKSRPGRPRIPVELRQLKEWVKHYNVARPHMALGPGVPDPPEGAVLRANEKSRHRLGERAVVCARSLLGGLHHEYSLTPALA